MPDFVLPDAPQVWLFTGDSVTQASRHTRGSRGYVEIFAERVRGELQRFDDAVINLGVSGWTIQDFLGRYRDQVDRFRPHVVSIMFGINDAKLGEAGIDRFRGRYRGILRVLRDDYPVQVVVQTPNGITGSQRRTQRASLPAYVEVVRELARQEDVVLVDNDALWEASGGDSLMDDDIHPNARGHAVLARSLLSTLGLWDSESEVARRAEPL